jgi:hypothetical protein
MTAEDFLTNIETAFLSVFTQNAILKEYNWQRWDDDVEAELPRGMMMLSAIRDPEDTPYHKVHVQMQFEGRPKKQKLSVVVNELKNVLIATTQLALGAACNNTVQFMGRALSVQENRAVKDGLRVWSFGFVIYALPIPVSPISNHLLNNLASYWKLDEASGVRADSYGTNNLADPNGCPSSAAIINKGAQFTGTQSLTLNSNPSVVVTGDFTFSLWIRIESQVTMIPFSKWVNPNYDYVLFYDASGGGMTFGSGTGSASIGALATLNQWNHYLCWYDSSDETFHMRINDNDATTFVSATGVTLTQSSGALWFGARDDSVLMCHATIDEVALWKRKLAPSEMTALYNGGAGLPFESFML